MGEGSVKTRKFCELYELMRSTILSHSVYVPIKRMNNRKRKGCEAVRGGRGPQHGLAEQTQTISLFN